MPGGIRRLVRLCAAVPLFLAASHGWAGDVAAPAVRALYRNRTAAARAALVGQPDGTTEASERAVEDGLAWLAKVQEQDGRWTCKAWGGGGEYDLGVSSLALMAFLGAGYTHADGRHAPTIARGIAWLRTQQHPNGGFAWRVFYEQGMATTALCEAHALTHDPELGRAAQQALDYLCKIQPEHGGFRYTGAVARDQGDLSVSGWQMMALANGLSSDLQLPQAALDRSTTLLIPQEAVERARVLLKNTYCGNGGSSYTVAGKTPSASMTAVGMLCRQLFGDETAGPEIAAAAQWLLAHARKTEAAEPLASNAYSTYYSALAMFQMGGEWWAEWNRRFRDPLAAAQVQDAADDQGRPIRGSWDPARHKFGQAGGRVYITAMAILCLETCYRFAPFYRGRGKLEPPAIKGTF